MLPHARSTTNAREMRKNLTPPEARLWQALRGKALDGLKFRRQHPIGPFILDFYCVSVRLAVEVDGSIHTLGDNPKRDDSRDLWLERHGITVLRIPAQYVLDRLDAVLTEIGRAAAMAETPWDGGGPLRRPAGDTSPLRGKRWEDCDDRLRHHRGAGSRAGGPFYDAVFGAIGGERKSFDGAWAFYGPKDGEGNVGVCKPHDGQRPEPATAS